MRPVPRHPVPAESGAALTVAEESAGWYRFAGARARRGYWSSEILVLVVAAAVPISGIITPGDARLASILGAVVVVLSGLRTLFNWRENWSRFAVAASGLKAEIRTYAVGGEPYDDPATRDARLVDRVNAIERAEVQGWIVLKAPNADGDQ
jgi:hypothetical protein